MRWNRFQWMDEGEHLIVSHLRTGGSEFQVFLGQTFVRVETSKARALELVAILHAGEERAHTSEADPLVVDLGELRPQDGMLIGVWKPEYRFMVHLTEEEQTELAAFLEEGAANASMEEPA